jgi:hypothetical protein
MSIVANFLNITKETELPTYFYKKDATDSERKNMWLKSIPKFGIRISLVHQYDYDDSVVNPYWPPGQTEEDSVVYGSIDNVKINGVSFPLLDFRQSTGGFTRDQSSTFEKNIKQKIGFIQTYRSYKIEENMVDRTEYFNNEFGTFYTKNRDLLRVSREVPRSLILRKAKRRMVMPILEKEIDLPEQLYNIDNSNPTSYFNFEPNTLGLWNAPWADSMRQILDSTYRAVKSEIINDPEFDILVNFCLLQGIGRNFSLFNSLVGLASEPIFKLLDGTKDLITKNYDIQKNSGNFNSRNNKGAYAKQKKQEQGGPPPLDFLKAAKTIPINLLKGISTAVDPNIFLADKIVLAGKMGFIQPKFKRVQEGDIIKIAGSDETVTITAEQSGVAYSGYYDYLETGELLIKPNPTDQGQPHTEFTVVALVDEQTNKIKKTTDSEGNQIVVTRQGPGVTGVPYDLKNKSFVDPNFKDTEEVEAFDIRPSTPIFPGESINIPYSVASLLLAPFPVFPPGASLTAYNLLMPFGPLFLALEPLIYETPEFKASIPKNNSKTEPKKDENGNVVCLEATPPVLRLTTVAILTALFFDESGNLRTFTYRNYEEFRQQARELLLQTLNNNSIVVEDSLLNSVVQEIATKITRGTLTKQSLKPILERLLR